MKLVKALIFSALALGLGPQAFAARAELLGQTVLNGNKDMDFVEIHSCAAERIAVSAVQLHILRNAARIDQLFVRYGNGQVERLDVKEFFAPGSATRWIDLAGGKRCVSAFRIVGGTPNSGFFSPNTLIQFYGLVTR